MTTGAVPASPASGATAPPVPRAPSPVPAGDGEPAEERDATAPVAAAATVEVEDEAVAVEAVAGDPGAGVAAGDVREAEPAAEPPRLVPSLLPVVDVTVERTVARWLGLSARPARLDWPRLLVGAMQHRVEGLCADALRALAWDEQAPPSVVHSLERRALLAESRFLAHYHALQELRDLDEELVASLVVLNGAAVVGDYAAASHRLVGDIDLYVDPEHAERLGERARRLGYWEKDGVRGPTYYKDVASGAAGAGYVGLDVQVAAPLDGVGDGRAEGHWAGNLVPHVVGDVKVHRPTPALEIVHQLHRLHEHAGSWARWVAEDDVRLIRVLDVELVAAALGTEGTLAEPVLDAGPAEDAPAGDAPEGPAAAGPLAAGPVAAGDDVAAGGEAVLAHAEALGVLSEVAVGAAAVLAMRGSLPPALAELEPYARVVEPCTRLLALPEGGLLIVDEPLAERALCVDKSARTRALAAGDGVAGTWSRAWRRPLPSDREGLAAIADRAADLLAEAGLVGA